MCGIFGFVTTDAAFAARADTSAALRALGHRGPDGGGELRSHAASVSCGLAHRRLAIIDLTEAAAQPMWSSDGRYAIVYNGEIYNYRELRACLSSEGVHLRTESDTEVVLEGYAHWGETVLGRLRGMFAFGIWDALAGSLFLARDHLGVKPLYVAAHGHGLSFGSEVRALVAAGVCENTLCPRGLRSYLTWGSVAEPETILEGVKALPPATHLRWSATGTTSRRYWRPRTSPGVERSFEESVEIVRPILRRAVESQLVADVPVGVFLSGGIDSSVIAAIASASRTRPLETFTVAFDEMGMSEARYASDVAALFGCNHHNVLLRPEEARDQLDAAFAAMDQPSADGINTYFVSKAVRASGISVALSGLGGDEVFAGYGSFTEFSLARRLAGRLPSSVGNVLESAIAASPLSAGARRARKLASLLAGPRGTVAAYASLRCMFTPMQVASLISKEIAHGIQPGESVTVSKPVGRPSDDPVIALSVMELSNYLKNTLLRDADVMSMAHSLEVRVPFLDHQLIDVVLPMPGRVKLRRASNKPLLVAAAPVLPRSAVFRPKMGFTLPFEQWLRGPLKARVDSMFCEARIKRSGLLAPAAVWRSWQAFLAGDPRVSYSRIWSLAALLAWVDAWEASL